MYKAISKAMAAALIPVCTMCFAADEATTTYGTGTHSFSLATGSPGELGLLKVLAEDFAVRADARMVWIKAGTGQSLELLKAKKVDMVMVHAPAQVDKAVQDGWGTHKTLIGSNEFYIVGPKSDPAGISKASSAADAYRQISSGARAFVSRGDNSGTHQKEMQIWKQAGVQPAGGWYIVTKDFMTASLKRANAEGAYFMSDSSTWIKSPRQPTASASSQAERLAMNDSPASSSASDWMSSVVSPERECAVASRRRSEFTSVPSASPSSRARQRSTRSQSVHSIKGGRWDGFAPLNAAHARFQSCVLPSGLNSASAFSFPARRASAPQITPVAIKRSEAESR